MNKVSSIIELEHLQCIKRQKHPKTNSKSENSIGEGYFHSCCLSRDDDQVLVLV